jgi:hypothetical protein
LLNDERGGHATGASADVAGMRDDEPMCMQITVAVSSHAAMNGSQRPSGSTAARGAAGSR